MKRRTLHNLVLIAALLGGTPFAMARSTGEEPAQPDAGILLNLSLGFQQWPALHGLEAETFGAFDEHGLNLAGGLHWPWSTRGGSALLVGFDLGAMLHESDIVAPGDYGTIDTNVFYIAPSLRWSFHRSRRLNVSLEAGVGAYHAEMREWIELRYDFIEGTRHFASWAPGGFVGLGMQVPVGRRDRWSISTGARVHLADFGNVEAFGRDIGRLDGPITTFQLGMNYEWKDR
jgi:hypothetical protein